MLAQFLNSILGFVQICVCAKSKSKFAMTSSCNETFVAHSPSTFTCLTVAIPNPRIYTCLQLSLAFLVPVTYIAPWMFQAAQTFRSRLNTEIEDKRRKVAQEIMRVPSGVVRKRSSKIRSLNSVSPATIVSAQNDKRRSSSVLEGLVLKHSGSSVFLTGGPKSVYRIKPDEVTRSETPLNVIRIVHASSISHMPRYHRAKKG